MPVHDLDLHRREVMVRGRPPVRLSVIDAGRSETGAPTLVFVHGFGGYSLQWKSQMLAFAATHRVVAADLRGHGLSDQPKGAYSIDDLVGDLARVVEALQLPPSFIVLGHSFGSAVAASYTARFPERVERLVFIGMSVDFFAIHTGARVAFHLPLTLLEPIRSLFPKQLAAPAHVLRSMYHQALSKWDGNEILSGIDQPALVVMGERDEVFGRKAYDAVPDRLPNSEVVKVSVSAHLVHLERPDAVNRAIARFIQTPLESHRQAPAKSVELIQQRPWLKHYEAGVPQTLTYPAQPIHRLLDTAAQRFPDRRAIVYEGRAASYRRLREATDQFANALIRHGLQKGERVAVLLNNCPELVIAHQGTSKAGGITVSLNPALDPALLARQIEDAGARIVVTDPALFAGRAWTRTAANVTLVLLVEPGTALRPTAPASWGPLLSQARRAPAGAPTGGGSGSGAAWPEGARIAAFGEALKEAWKAPPQVEVAPEDVAVIEYSTGTTGEPKGIMLTHANLMANVVQLRHWLEDLVDGDEVVLCALSLWHSYGMTGCLNVGLSVAATLVLLPKPDTPSVLRSIVRYRPTIFPGVPEMYLGINIFPNVRRFDLKSIRTCVSGAAPLPLEVQEVFERLTRGRLVEGYGLTEAGPVTHVNPFYGLRKQGCIGVPLPDTDARIVDPLTREPLPVGATGELAVKGPQVMKGYWNNAALTAEKLRDGWLMTGDVARMDADGFFRIINRLKDVIALEAGHIYPREVEEVIYENPKVYEVAVAGGTLAGRTIVVAHVVPNRGAVITEAELIAFCRGRMPEHAVPGRVEIRESLPKTYMGKVARAGLTG